MMSLDEMTGGEVVRVWFDRASIKPFRQAVVLLEARGGPRMYRRVWLDGSPGMRMADWTDYRSSDAVLIAGDPE